MSNIDFSQKIKTKSTAEIENDRSISEAKEYLKSTDWYVIRQIETGEAIPESVKESRQSARQTLS